MNDRLRPRPTLPAIDSALVKRRFNRISPRYDDASFLDGEIGGRLLEHLDPVSIAPRSILDIGAGTRAQTRALAKRYPKARVFAVDVAHGMLREGRARGPKLFSKQSSVCARAELLPFAGPAFELVHANLLLPWSSDLDATLGELARVMHPEALFIASSFGPDTLKELRESWAAVDREPHVHPFPDMHDIGDALVRAGFGGVVMDAERLTLQYRDVGKLLEDLRSTGGSYAGTDRRRGLTGKTRLLRMKEAYQTHRRDGLLPASVEVVYAHAWLLPAKRSVEVTLPSVGAFSKGR